MCATCVSQSVVYVGGAVVALQALRARARAARQPAGAAGGPSRGEGREPEDGRAEREQAAAGPCP